MARVNRDIHKTNQRLETRIRTLKTDSEINSQNKKLILLFDDYCKLQNKSKPTRYKRLYTLATIARAVKKTFTELSKKELEAYIIDVNSWDRPEKSKQVYKVTLKLFFRWLYKEKKIEPELWVWLDENLKTTIPKKKNKTLIVDKSALITEKEIQKLLKVSIGMDRAFIFALYETGARIGELLPLRRGDISFEKGGYAIIHVDGKTGEREIAVKNCVPDLLNWMHQLPDSPNQPLWIVQGTRGAGNQYDYRSMKRHLYAIAKKAFPEKDNEWIQAKFHPHNFRHSRATICAKRGWSEFVMCTYFGWEIGSKVPSVYVKLSGKDVINQLRKDNGEIKEKQEPSKLANIKCKVCGTQQSTMNKVCENCTTPLSIEEFVKVREKEKKKQNAEHILGRLTLISSKKKPGEAITAKDLMAAVRSVK